MQSEIANKQTSESQYCLKKNINFASPSLD